MDRRGEHRDEMWDEQDGFFYDVLRLPDGRAMRLKVRSLVGLLPLCASAVIEPDAVARFPRLMAMIAQFRERHPELVSQVAPTEAGFIGHNGRRLLSILNRQKLERVLGYLLDENEFLGPHGIRSLSRYHLEHPFVFHVGGQEYKVQYLPAESNTGMFGGNSNWRGPVWMPVNALIVRGAGEPVRLLRRRLHGRMPDRLGAADDAVRGGAGDRAPADEHFPARRRRPAAGLRRDGASSRTIRTGATSSCSTSTSTATTAPASAPATRRAGPASSPRCWTCSAGSTPRPCSRSSAGSVLARVVREQVGGEPARETLRSGHVRPTLPVAVPDQHPRLADRAVAPRSAGARRWTTSPTPSSTAWRELGFDWVWFLSVWQTGPAAQAVSRAQSRVAPRVRRRRCPTSRDEDIAGSGFAIQATPSIATSAATRRWPACASGCSSAA